MDMETAEIDVLVVGAGAAGSMAAIRAQEEGSKVLMITSGVLPKPLFWLPEVMRLASRAALPGPPLSAGDTEWPTGRAPSSSIRGWLPTSNLARVKVFRLDPAVDKGPRYDTFEGIPYEGCSVLEVIQTIYEEREPSLAFRQGCLNGTCVSCAVAVNGKTMLACQNLAEEEMVIEPHPKYKIIKDLVVDFNETTRQRAKPLEE